MSAPNLRSCRSVPVLLGTAIFLSTHILTAQVTRSFTEPVQQRDVAVSQLEVISKVVVAEGDAVRRGELLAELDNSVLRKNLKIAELRARSVTEMQSAEIRAKVARKKYEKLAPMLEQGHANPAEIDKAQAEFESADAELQRAREKREELALEVERIRAEIERTMIRSPIDGVVTKIYCRSGEFISSQERKLATVVRLDQLRIRFYLLQETVAALQAGNEVTLWIGNAAAIVKGKVEFVSPVIDADSGTARVDVLIDNQLGRWHAGTVCGWSSTASLGGSPHLVEETAE